MAFRFGLLALLALVAQSAVAQSEEIDRLLEETGLQQQILQLPEAMDEITTPILRSTCQRCTPQTIATTSAAFRQAFAPASLYEDIRQRFTERYNSAYALQVFQDMERTVYGKMARLDIWADQSEQRKIMGQVEAGANPPFGNRLLLLRRLADASGTNDAMVSLVCQIVRSVSPSPVNCASFNGFLKTAYSEAVVKRWYYLYQNLSDDDLAEAIRIARTPAERWFIATFAQATGGAFSVRLQGLTTRLARELAPPTRQAR